MFSNWPSHLQDVGALFVARFRARDGCGIVGNWEDRFWGGNDRGGAKPLVFVYPSAIHNGESVEEVENGRMKFVAANKPPIITKFRFD